MAGFNFLARSIIAVILSLFSDSSDHVTRLWVRECSRHPGVVPAPRRMLGDIMNQDLCTKLSPIEEVVLYSDVFDVNSVVCAVTLAWHA